MRQILIPLYLLVFISCNEMTQTKSTPEIINLPESKATNFETNDSSFLKIKIKNENYETLFLNIPSTFKTINSLDSFLQKNKNLLDKNKVLVTGFDNNEKYEGFKKLLLKYGISKFRVNSEGGLISPTREFLQSNLTLLIKGKDCREDAQAPNNSFCATQKGQPYKMTYDFFATKSDKINLLDFIFRETDLKIYDLASSYGQEILEYKTTDEIVTKFDLENAGHLSPTFQLWTQRFGGDIFFRKVDLNPKYCNGHTFRYSTDGWGLIQLYFGGHKDNVLFHSHIGHFNEKGALRWQDTNKVIDSVDKWNWKIIEQTSRQLKNQIHNKLAAKKIGRYGVLQGADLLSNSGTKLWGTIS